MLQVMIERFNTTHYCAVLTFLYFLSFVISDRLLSKYNWMRIFFLKTFLHNHFVSKMKAVTEKQSTVNFQPTPLYWTLYSRQVLCFIDLQTNTKY